MAGKLKDEIGKRLPFESLEQEALLNLIKTADGIMRGVARALKPAGLSSTQYNVLRILRGVGVEGLSCREVAERMITRDPDLTRLLDRLEKRELVRRQRESNDRRVVRVQIAEAGLALLASLDQPVAELNMRQLQHLGRERLALLVELLEQVREKFDD